MGAGGEMGRGDGQGGWDISGDRQVYVSRSLDVSLDRLLRVDRSLDITLDRQL